MSNREYIFDVHSSQDLTYKTPDNITIFHQICGYPNPRTFKHCVRTLSVNGENEIIQTTEKCYDKKSLRKFLGSSRGNDYKIYSTYDLNSIPIPTCGELLIAKSEILSHDFDYSGFAPF